MLEFLDIERQPRIRAAWEELLTKAGLKVDPPCPRVLGLFEDGQLIASGTRDHNRIKCVAVALDFQGGPAFNRIMSGLITDAYEEGVEHLFLYTKKEAVHAFSHLGFHPLASTAEGVTFMERGISRIDDFLQKLKEESARHGEEPGPAESIVMNANPFTLGHRALVEDALSRASRLHLFILSEDLSAVPADIRFHLVREGTKDLPGIIYHPTDSYIISRASFPTYFLKQEDEGTRTQARLDAILFRDSIAPTLGITGRTVGDEPFDRVTSIYNECLKEELEGKIQLTLMPRVTTEDGLVISASQVREELLSGPIGKIRPLVPDSTYNFFRSEEGRRLVQSWKE